MNRSAVCVLCGLLAAAAASRADPAPTASAPAGLSVVRVPLPEIPDADAIWGATGRDARGHVWFGVSSHAAVEPSARLVEYVPATGKAVDRGDVLSQLKACGRYRQGMGQAKIHSKICQAGDGNLYFTSMDEQGEEHETDTPPTWGSHLWRLRPGGGKWQHVMAAPEGLIAAAAAGRTVYALGYFGHVLYAYDVRTGRSRSVKVGADGGHVSRNIFTDARGHVFVPRLRWTGWGEDATTTLVEFDPQLREVGRRPVAHYGGWYPLDVHGIIGFQPLGKAGIAWTTHRGRLYLVRPPAGKGPAGMDDLGWFHPGGDSYASSLFDDGAGRLVGVTRRRGRLEWVEYDLKTRKARAVPFEITHPRPEPIVGTMLYGSVTRDDAGNYYVVGAEGHRHGAYDPLVLQVRPHRAKREGS